MLFFLNELWNAEINLFIPLFLTFQYQNTDANHHGIEQKKMLEIITLKCLPEIFNNHITNV